MIDVTNNKELIDQLEFLKNRLHEDDSIAALDAVIDKISWKKFTFQAEHDLLKDHHFYLVAHKGYGTPMKAKWHQDCAPHFEVLIGDGKTNEYVSIFDEKITHWKELDDKPE